MCSPLQQNNAPLIIEQSLPNVDQERTSEQAAAAMCSHDAEDLIHPAPKREGKAEAKSATNDADGIPLHRELRALRCGRASAEHHDLFHESGGSA